MRHDRGVSSLSLFAISPTFQSDALAFFRAKMNAALSASSDTACEIRWHRESGTPNSVPPYGIPSDGTRFEGAAFP